MLGQGQGPVEQVSHTIGHNYQSHEHPAMSFLFFFFPLMPVINVYFMEENYRTHLPYTCSFQLPVYTYKGILFEEKCYSNISFRCTFNVYES